MFSLLKLSVPVCFAILPVAVRAGDPYVLPAGAAPSGMAFVSVMKKDFWSSVHNPGSLSYVRKTTFGTSCENRFGIPGLGTVTAAAVIPVSRSSLGLDCSMFGNSDFRRQKASLACGLPLGPAFSAGIRIDYFSERTYGNYSNIGYVTFETGAVIRISNTVNAGIHIFNPLPSSLRKRPMATVLSTGMGAEIGTGLFIGSECEISTGGGAELRTGFEYELSKRLWIRGGYKTGHSSFCFGLGYKTGPAVADVSFTTHERLGITSSVSLTFNINRPK